MADKVPDSPSSKVKFVDGDIDKASYAKQVPTQRYDRKEIQKRLELESWMETELQRLYKGQDYPQLDVDDVHKINPEEREEKLKAYLSEAKHSPDSFIKELISKASDIKPVENP